MARPFAPTEAFGNSTHGLSGRAGSGSAGSRAGNGHQAAVGVGQDELIELAQLRAENAQLHQLCVELEQALQEATPGTDVEARLKEYETLLEEKSQTIRELHLQLAESRAAAVEQVDAKSANTGAGTPAPGENELLALSEELERERRQLQEDEQSLMEQMREMEVGMARERAEMARQRNDLQRLQGEIRHEIERLERNGALHSKIEGLKNRLQDATARRGAAPAQSAHGATPQPAPNQQMPSPQTKGGSFMGRLFGK